MNLILYLSGILIEKISVIVTVAFILTRFTWFRKLLDGKLGTNGKYLTVLFFSSLGILGTYTGIVVNPEDLGFPKSLNGLGYNEAIVNARVVGVAIGGMLGGPYVGFITGLIAGTHRYFLGGFTDIACSISTVFEGLLAGLVAKYVLNYRQATITESFIIGFLAECCQMVIILIIAKPFDKALHLVQLIGLPMILANSVGIAIFIAIVQNVLQKEQEVSANFALKALLIADKTLPYLRKGLTIDSAEKAAGIILKETGVAAVALTDHHQILAFAGLGSDHHKPKSPIITDATRVVLKNGQSCLAKSKAAIGCTNRACPLNSAIILPLKPHNQVIGTLKLYFSQEGDVSLSLLSLADGLANLFSTQLELARLDEQQRLLADAEIKALQAQINPHFLFNSLNTIVALIRRNPDLARKISINLGQFLRSNINAGHQRWRTLADELTHIKDYLAIEQVRFSDKLNVEYDIDEDILTTLVPPLILLPLVENAFKHGFSTQNNYELIRIKVKKTDINTIIINVCDNGIGMSSEMIKNIYEHKRLESKTGTGLGLYSVIKRLKSIYHGKASLNIDSTIGKGTCVTLTLPITFSKHID